MSVGYRLIFLSLIQAVLIESDSVTACEIAYKESVWCSDTKTSHCWIVPPTEAVTTVLTKEGLQLQFLTTDDIVEFSDNAGNNHNYSSQDMNGRTICENAMWSFYSNDQNRNFTFSTFVVYRYLILCSINDAYDITLCDGFQFSTCNPLRAPTTESDHYNKLIVNETTGQQQVLVNGVYDDQFWMVFLNENSQKITRPYFAGGSIVCDRYGKWILSEVGSRKYTMTKFLVTNTWPNNLPIVVRGCDDTAFYDTTMCPRYFKYGCDTVPIEQAFIVIQNDTTLNKQLKVLMPPDEVWYWLLLDGSSGAWLNAAYMLNNTFFCASGANTWYAYNQMNKYPSPVLAWVLSKTKPMTTPPPALCGLPYGTESPDCYDGGGYTCRIIPRAEAVTITLNPDSSQQLVFLTSNVNLVLTDMNGVYYNNLTTDEINGHTQCKNGIWWFYSTSRNRTFSVSSFVTYTRLALCSDASYNATLCDKFTSNCQYINKLDAFTVIVNQTTGQQQMKVLSPPNELWWWIATNSTDAVFTGAADNNSIYCDNGAWVINQYNVKRRVTYFLFSRTQPMMVQLPQSGCSDDAHYDTTICKYPYGCDMVPQSEAFTVIINQTTGSKQLKILMPADETWYWLVRDDSGRTWLNKAYEINNTFFCMSNAWYAYNQWNLVPSPIFALAFSRRGPSNTPLPNTCQINYETSFICTSDVLCTRLEQSEAVKIIIGSDGIQQLFFLVDTSTVQTINSSVSPRTTHLAQSLNGKTKCNNGSWAYDGISFNYFVVFTESDCQSCPSKVNYDPSICQQVLSLDPFITNCNPVYDTNTLFTITDNGACSPQSVTFLTKTLLAAIILPYGGLFRASFPSDYLKGRVSCTGTKWQYYDTAIKQNVIIGKLLIFKNESAVTTLPPPNCRTCPANVNYDSTLCARLKVLDPTVVNCNPISSTSSLFTINSGDPCMEQTVTFLTASLKTAIFLEDGTLFRTPFASSVLKGKVFCTLGTWQFYDSGTKQAINIGKLMMFTDEAPTTTLPPPACSSCSPDVNYDSTICPLVKQVLRNPPVTICNPVTDTTTIFKITDNGVCKEQTATFLTKTLSTAIFLPNGTIYNNIFASDALKGVVTCSRGIWYIYNKSAKTNYEIGKLIMFTEK